MLAKPLFPSMSAIVFALAVLQFSQHASAYQYFTCDGNPVVYRQGDEQPYFTVDYDTGFSTSTRQAIVRNMMAKYQGVLNSRFGVNDISISTNTNPFRLDNGYNELWISKNLPWGAGQSTLGRFTGSGPACTTDPNERLYYDEINVRIQTTSNADWNWNNYRRHLGPQPGEPNANSPHRTILHEIGHAVGLAHEWSVLTQMAQTKVAKYLLFADQVRQGIELGYSGGSVSPVESELNLGAEYLPFPDQQGAINNVYSIASGPAPTNEIDFALSNSKWSDNYDPATDIGTLWSEVRVLTHDGDYDYCDGERLTYEATICNLAGKKVARLPMTIRLLPVGASNINESVLIAVKSLQFNRGTQGCFTNSYTVTVPASLPTGDYFLDVEIAALTRDAKDVADAALGAGVLAPLAEVGFSTTGNNRLLYPTQALRKLAKGVGPCP